MFRGQRTLWQIGLVVSLYGTVAHADPGGDCDLGAPLQPWVLAGALPANVSGIATGGGVTPNHLYWYAFQDSDVSSANVASYFTEIAPDGTLGQWLPTSSRTVYRNAFRTIATPTHVYVAGGNPDSGCTNTGLVEYAAINSDGTLGIWRTTSSLNVPRQTFGLIISGNHIYALGGDYACVGYGYGRVTEYAAINADGSLEPWQFGPELNVDHPYTAAIIFDNHLYVFGGSVHAYITNAVEQTVINPDGSFGPWVSDKPLPQPRGNMGVTVIGRTIYVAGGHYGLYGTNWTPSVVSATILPDYTLSDWNDSASLNEPTWGCQLSRFGYHLLASGSPSSVEHSSVSFTDCNSNGLPDECELDTDGDGMIDSCDNCATVPNANQSNADGDDIGDVCDGCPNDASKIEPGVCDCGVSDAIGFVGFLPPIGGADATGGSFADPLRAFKLGSTIPVKFAASQCGDPLLTGIHTLQAVKYSSLVDSDLPIDATPTDVATTGNQFRLTDGGWHFNLSTRTGFSTGTWKLIATLSDGSTHYAWITIKK